MTDLERDGERLTAIWARLKDDIGNLVAQTSEWILHPEQDVPDRFEEEWKQAFVACCFLFLAMIRPLHIDVREQGYDLRQRTALVLQSAIRRLRGRTSQSWIGTRELLSLMISFIDVLQAHGSYLRDGD